MRCVWAFSCLMLSAVTACAPPKSENQPTAMGPGGSASEVGSSRDAGPSRPAPVAGKIEADDATAPNLADVPFTLRDQTGEEFSSSQLEGKVWMGAIFFANCPGPCFRENQEIADILRTIESSTRITRFPSSTSRSGVYFVSAFCRRLVAPSMKVRPV